MKRILITGANGFIGSYLAKRFATEEYDVVAPNHSTLNLLDWKATSEFFRYDTDYYAIIHCAADGGRRLISDNEVVFHKNLYMFENIARFADSTRTFIHFGSGSEKFWDAEPELFYPLSKYVINKRIESIQNAHNLIVYGCFGENEEPQRFVRSCVTKCVKNEPIIIPKDKIMSYIYIDDLYKYVEYFIIGGTRLRKCVDTVYSISHSLSEIAAKVVKICNSNNSIEVSKNQVAPYCGQYTKEIGDKLDLLGFDSALEKVVKNLKGEVE